jgi:hypothetical protein
MNDLVKAAAPKSDQLNADDLIAGAITIKITKVTVANAAEQKVSINFEGDENKPYKPCKSMVRVLLQVWGDDSNQYIGRHLTLYRDPSVKWAGEEIGGIRISHMSHITEPQNLVLTASKTKRTRYIVNPLANPAPTENAPPKDPMKVLSAKILADIRAEDNEAGLIDLINMDYVDDLEKVKQHSEKAYDFLMAEYNKRLTELKEKV